MQRESFVKWQKVAVCYLELSGNKMVLVLIGTVSALSRLSKAPMYKDV